MIQSHFLIVKLQRKTIVFLLQFIIDQRLVFPSLILYLSFITLVCKSNLIHVVLFRGFNLGSRFELFIKK